MNTLWSLFIVGMSSSATGLAAAASTLPPGVNPFGTATLESKSGASTTGAVELVEKNNSLYVRANIHNATPGVHGFHIHENGD